MLQSLSDGAKKGFSKFILVGFLFMAVLGLVLTDVGGFFRDGIGGRDVAKVGSRTVGLNEFDQYARRVLSEQGLGVEQAYQFGILTQILNAYLRDQLFMEQGTNYGLHIPENVIAERVRTLVEPFIQDGRSPQQALNQILAGQGLSESAFTNMIHIGIQNELLSEAITSGVTFTPDLMLETLARFEGERRDIELIAFNDADITLEEEITETDIEEFYEFAKQADYAIPERRTFTLATLDPERLAASVTISDEALQVAYEENIGAYETGETRTLAQIVTDSESAAQQLIDSARENNRSLEEAANELEGARFNRLEGIEVGGLPEDISNAAFAEEAEEGTLIGPFETPLGWQIFEVESITPPFTQPFEEVAEDLRAVMLLEMQADTLFETLGIIDDQIADGVPLEELIELHSLETATLGPVDRFGGGTGDQGSLLEAFEADQGDILESAFSLFEQEISPAIELSSGQFALIRLESITAPDTRPLDEVRDDIIERLTQTRLRTQNMINAQAHLATLQSGIQDLQAVARNTQKRVRRLSDIGRMSSSEDLPEPLTQSTHAALFQLEEGEVELLETRDGFLLARISSVRIPETDELNEDALKDIESVLRQSKDLERQQSYAQFISDNVNVYINNTLLQQIYGLNETR